MRYLATFAICCMILYVPTTAQDRINESVGKKRNNKKFGKLNRIRTKAIPKKWSIKEEVKSIEKSLDHYDPLIRSLEEANTDLKSDLTAYLKNPGDKVLAARINAKMSNYAKKIVFDVDKVISDQDTLLSVFTELDHKLNKFTGYLDFKVNELNTQVKKYRKNGKRLKKRLIKLSLKIKNTDDPQMKAQYTQEFRKIFNKYNINARYEQGISRNKEDYATLSKNLGSLVKMFSVLDGAFRSLIENLEAEKNYLLDNIRLQADQIQVQKLVHEGISDGSRAVVKVTKKLAVLYAQVEGFAKVHEKINRDMAKFSDTSKILGALVNEIEKAPFKNAPTVDKAIEYFSTLDVDDDEEEDDEE